DPDDDREAEERLIDLDHGEFSWVGSGTISVALQVSHATSVPASVPGTLPLFMHRSQRSGIVMALRMARRVSSSCCSLVIGALGARGFSMGSCLKAWMKFRV